MCTVQLEYIHLHIHPLALPPVYTASFPLPSPPHASFRLHPRPLALALCSRQSIPTIDDKVRSGGKSGRVGSEVEVDSFEFFRVSLSAHHCHSVGFGLHCWGGAHVCFEVADGSDEERFGRAHGRHGQPGQAGRVGDGHGMATMFATRTRRRTHPGLTVLTRANSRHSRASDFARLCEVKNKER